MYLKACLTLLACLSPLVAAEDRSLEAFRAIRNNDLPTLQSLLKSGMDVNVTGDRATTALLYASAFGSLDSMKILIDAGANVNAKNAFDATPLIWAVNDARKVKLLLDHGADANAKAKLGRTALLLASMRPDGEPVARMLIAKGADTKAKDEQGYNFLLNSTLACAALVPLALEQGIDINATDQGGNTPLMNAAASGNVAAVKMLLARGADPNKVTAPELGKVKNGPIKLGSFTALILASTYGPPAIVDMLLKAGAKVDAKDVRGMTALHYAVSSDHQDPAIVKLLLAANADLNAKMETGETPADWVRKFGHPEISGLVGVTAVQPKVVRIALDGAPDARTAVEKSLGLLGKVSGKFLDNGGCVACHAQNLTAVAISLAAPKGVHIDPGFSKQMEMEAKGFWLTSRDGNLLRMDPPGGSDMMLYAMLGLNATGYRGDAVTDSILLNVLAQQSPEGDWSNAGFARAPMQDSPLSRTALSIRMMREYSWPAQAKELAVSTQRARKFLENAKVIGTEDRAFQILGISWAGGDPKIFAQALIKGQRADGGWAQIPYLGSDAYATGQALYALLSSGFVKPADPVYRNGAAYLLGTQAADGSWHVASRSPKFQPYFQSGFPYDHDQWISMAGTAWGAIGLTYGIEPKTSGAKAK